MKKVDNRIFCTFVSPEDKDAIVEYLTKYYPILYNRIFILSTSIGGYILTYDLCTEDISRFPENTILVHRRKKFNTLYTINALNLLIKSVNNGILDRSYNVNWEDYRNSLLISKDGTFQKIDTNLYKILTF